jgi:Domain of unknown function (DUF4185)
MGASAYIGRVGGLAVALGVGAAVATGHGIAWASPTESTNSTSEPSATEGAGTEGAGTQSGAAPADPSATDPPAPDPPEESPAARLSSRANSLLSSLTRAAERGIAISTGGALTSRKVTGNADTEEKAAAEEAEEAEPVAAQPPTPPVEHKSSGGVAKTFAENAVGRLSTPKSTPDVRTARDIADKVVRSVEAVNPISQRAAVGSASTSFQALAAGTTVRDEVPAMTATRETPSAQPTMPRLLTNVLSVFGIGPSASTTPGAPVGSPLALALAALGVRRESEQRVASTTTSGSSVAALTLTGAPTAAVAAPDPAIDYVVTPRAVSSNTDFITNLTGPGGLNNTKQRFGVGGTDLGIMWDNGIDDDVTTPVNEHQVLVLFGDTFYNDVPVRSGVWRNNTLFRSSDNRLSNGMYVRDGSIPIDNTTADEYSGAPLVYNPDLQRNIFKQVIANERYAVGPDVTIIPTSAVSVPYENDYGSRQYATFMSVRSWDTAGRWTTNYSGVAFSDDNGVTWHVAPESIRANAPGFSTVPYVSGNQNFQQFALVKPPVGSPEAQQGWVYAYGTPSGRAGTVYLSRVHQDQILDATKYQYWNGTTWVTNNPAVAKPILPGTTSRGFFGFGRTTTYPAVGEMSVQYNAYEGKYLMLTTDTSGNVVMRKADKPEGPWSAPITLVSGTRMPGAYAPMIHPWSSTENVAAADRKYLYWNLSTWNDYQVKTMRTDLSKV